jgi:hypothetical protein
MKSFYREQHTLLIMFQGLSHSPLCIYPYIASLFVLDHWLLSWCATSSIAWSCTGQVRVIHWPAYYERSWEHGAWDRSMQNRDRHLRRCPSPNRDSKSSTAVPHRGLWGILNLVCHYTALLLLAKSSLCQWAEDKWTEGVLLTEMDTQNTFSLVALCVCM